MYAVIRTGGKQYRVEPGQRLRIDRLPGAEGDRIDFPDVLLLGEGEETEIGTPTVADARVVAEILTQGRDKKVLVFKYKNKIRYRRLIGHRQRSTTVAIQEIVGPDGRSWGPPVKAQERAGSEADATDTADAPDADADGAVEAPAGEAAPDPQATREED